MNLRLTPTAKYYIGIESSIKASDNAVSYLNAAIKWGNSAKKFCASQSYVGSSQSPVHIFTGKVDMFLETAGSELSFDDSDPFANYSDIFRLNQELKSSLQATSLSSVFEGYVNDLLNELKTASRNL